jgi:hypothetical protein
MYGPEGIQFYTRVKVVTSRWPDPGTSKVDLGFPRATLTGPAGGPEDARPPDAGAAVVVAGAGADVAEARVGTARRLPEDPGDPRAAGAARAVGPQAARAPRTPRAARATDGQVLPDARHAGRRPAGVVRRAPRRSPDESCARHRGVLDPAHAWADDDSRRARRDAMTSARRDHERSPPPASSATCARGLVRRAAGAPAARPGCSRHRGPTPTLRATSRHGKRDPARSLRRRPALVAVCSCMPQRNTDRVRPRQ